MDYYVVVITMTDSAVAASSGTNKLGSSLILEVGKSLTSSVELGTAYELSLTSARQVALH